MKKRGLILVILMFVGLVACDWKVPDRLSISEQLKDTGLIGERPLARLESFSTIKGTINGGFFLGTGSLNGSIESDHKLRFWWQPKTGEIVTTALPYSKFRFIIDETKLVPTAEFVFHSEWLNKKPSDKSGEFNNDDKTNLNNFLLSEYLLLVRIRIAKKTLEKEVYLPKIK